MNNKNDAEQKDFDPPPLKRRRLTQYSQNEPKEAPQALVTTLTTQGCRLSLKKILSRIDIAVNVSTMGIATGLPQIFGLNVDNIGDIGFPLTQREANTLINVCDKDNNDDNTPQAKAHHLDAKKFRFTHPQWNKGIQRLAQQVALHLGCDRNIDTDKRNYNYNQWHQRSNVIARCDKLLIYAKDRHFVNDKNRDRAPETFARLIIQLPSVFKIKDEQAPLTVEYKGEEYNHYFGMNVRNVDKDENSCKFNIYYAGHYFDLVGKVNEIKSGYRIVVIYNLCWQGDMNIIPSIERFEQPENELRAIIEAWNNNKNDNKVIGINLKHSYEKDELLEDGSAALIGADFERIYLLQRALDTIPMNERLQICIGMFSRHIEENNVADYPFDDWDSDIDYDLCEWQISSQNVYFDEIVCDVNGEKIRHIDTRLLGFNVETDCIDLFDIKDDGWDIESDDYSCDIEGEPIHTTIDKKFVVLIWKKKSEFDMIVTVGGFQTGVEMLRNMVGGFNHSSYGIISSIYTVLNAFDIKRYDDQDLKHFDEMIDIILSFHQPVILCNFVKRLIYDLTCSKKKTHEVITIMLKKLVTSNLDPMVESIIGEYLDVLLHHKIDVNEIRDYCDFVLGINQINEEYGDCLTKILMEKMKCKLELRKDGTAMSNLRAETIIDILNFCVGGDINISDTSNFLEAFEIKYFTNVNKTIGNQVARLLWRNKCQETLLQSQFAQNVIESRINDLEKQLSNASSSLSAWSRPAIWPAIWKNGKLPSFLKEDKLKHLEYMEELKQLRKLIVS